MRGHCLCRAVAYELDPPITSVAHCHCESCRRAHSAAFASWATVPRGNLRVTVGADRLVAYPSSPGARRSFCGVCGSQLFMDYDADPEWSYVTLASFSTPPDGLPTRHYSFEERVGWFPFHDPLPKVRAKSSDPVE